MVFATMQQSLRVQQAPSCLFGSPSSASQAAVRSPATRCLALQQNSNRTQPKVTEVTNDPVREGPTAAAKCWCGKSKRKPFCDGSHAKKVFDIAHSTKAGIAHCCLE
ncbi:TPA: hypothetical protein ACH3X2_007484 [Trebouxia sp. C0005]